MKNIENINSQMKSHPNDDDMKEEYTENYDDRLRQLENLLNSYSEKSIFDPRKIKSITLWLHRWITNKIQTRSFDAHIELSALQAYGKNTEKETLALKRKFSSELSESSTKLRERLTESFLAVEIQEALKSGYLDLKKAIQQSSEEKYQSLGNHIAKLGQPSWESLQSSAIAHLALIEAVSCKVTDDLTNAKSRMGQPPKTDRDSLFFCWQKQIASDLGMSVEQSTSLACLTWNLYASKEDQLKEDSATKVIKARRAAAKGK